MSYSYEESVNAAIAERRAAAARYLAGSGNGDLLEVLGLAEPADARPLRVGGPCPHCDRPMRVDANGIGSPRCISAACREKQRGLRCLKDGPCSDHG